MKRHFLFVTAFSAFFACYPLFGQVSAASLQGADASPIAAGVSGVTSDTVVSRPVSDTIPSLLAGIWQGSDRLVLFGKERAADGTTEFAVVLREFYGWYADRASEPARYAELATRPRNNATATPAEHISVRYVTVAENASHTAGAYELLVLYPGEKTPVSIPVAVVDGKLYLDFLVRGNAQYTDALPELSSPANADESAEAPNTGFWRDQGAASGLLISPPAVADELTAYYIADDVVYPLRYWLTEMPYTYETVYVVDGGKRYAVDKYLRVAGNVYTCATGRRTQVRNLKRAAALPSEHSFDSDGVICALGSPYLTRVDDKETPEDLLALVSESNARKAPARKPPFPPVFPRVRWPNYDELDLYNPAIWTRRVLDIGK